MTSLGCIGIFCPCVLYVLACLKSDADILYKVIGFFLPTLLVKYDPDELLGSIVADVCCYCCAMIRAWRIVGKNDPESM